MWGWISGSKTTTPNIPVSVGDEYGVSLSGKSVFKLHHGVRKSPPGDSITVFKFEASPSTTPDQKAVAKAEFKQMRVLRHPNIVKYLDGADADTSVVMVTEEVSPLVDSISGGGNNLNENTICWGLHQLVVALKFLHSDCNVAHRNLYTSSVFVAKSGEWKLGGVAWCSPETTLLPPSRIHQYLSKYDPPEVLRGVSTGHHQADIWSLGILMWEVFNGSFLPSSQAIRDTSKLPQKLIPVYRRCVSANYKSRPSAEHIFDELSKPGGYFDNHFVSANVFLNELSIKESPQKQHFFAQIGNQLGSFPEEFCKYKILPGLITTFDFGDVGISVLPTLFKLGKMLLEDEYKKSIIPCVLKLFSSTDRAIRIQLLSSLDNFIEYIDKGVVDQQIFQAVATGFTDTVPGMREQTVKAMLLIAPKLSESTIDNILLKYLAKAQTDPEAPIRTNTTICISKICCHFSDATRRKVLIPAFLRACKDPFLHARYAGLVSLGVTSQYYHEPDIASRILPAICPLLIDHEKTVRDQAMKTAKLFIDKIEKHYKGEASTESTTKEPEVERPQETPGWKSMLSMSRYIGGGDAQSTESTQLPSNTSHTIPPSKQVSRTKPKQPPQRVIPKSAEVKTEDTGEDDDWGDGWDDDEGISSPSLNPPLPKTKSSMKLGGRKPDPIASDNDFVSSILQEERDLLKKQSPGSFIPAAKEIPGSFGNKNNNVPAPWDVPLAPRKEKSPWDQDEVKDNKLSSYFTNDLNTDDFFSEMGVSKKDKKETTSEWDNFSFGRPKSAVHTPEGDDWGDDWNAPVPNRCTSQNIPEPSTGNVVKPKSGFGDWEEEWEGGDTTSGLKPVTTSSRLKPSGASSRLQPKIAANRVKPNSSNDWDSWGGTSTDKTTGGGDDWGDDTWDEKQRIREEKRRQQQEKRAARAAERGTRRGGGLGGIRKMKNDF